MKVHISVDIEGCAGVNSPLHTSPKGDDYGTARLQMSREASAAVEGCLQAGADEVVITDAHGYKTNLVLEEIHPAARIITGPTRILGMMEGIGYLERWVFEVLEGLGATKLQNVYVTGGAARSETWLSIRASILGLQLQRPAVAESAFGAAILAASGKLGGVSAATSAMVRPDVTIDPEPGLQAAYEKGYRRFREACAARGYGVP